MAVLMSPNLNLKPAFRSRSGKKFVLSSNKLDSVPIKKAPMRTANSGAGKPKGIFTLLRISFINAAFDNGAGEVQFTTPVIESFCIKNSTMRK